MFFVFGTYKNKKRCPDSVFGEYNQCIRNNCDSRLAAIEVGRTCHFCFIPLFPLSKQIKVICPVCHYTSDLNMHLQSAPQKRPLVVQGFLAVAEEGGGDYRDELPQAKPVEMTVSEQSPVEAKATIIV